MTGFACAGAASAHDVTTAATKLALRRRSEALAATADQALLRELDDAAGRRCLADQCGTGVVVPEQLQSRLGVVRRDDHAEAAAHVEDLVELGVLDTAALRDLHEHGWHGERSVDPVAGVRLEAQQVQEAVPGD